MNYIRGAVNAISAPYQYYKDINPSTLTGAIDIIVVKRPKGNGDSELACTPFHVRFGKWQVLRPSEKKVNVSVNGELIPFNMKIGEAGEAFFVFETDEDVPDELITSPILLPTQPEGGRKPDVPTDRISARRSEGDEAGMDVSEMAERTEESQEPEFLDLNASESPSPDERPGRGRDRVNMTLPPESIQSPSLPPPTPSITPAEILGGGLGPDSMSLAVDQATSFAASARAPKIIFTDDLAIDAAGYHSQDREKPDANKPDPSTTPSSFAPTPQLSRAPTPLQHSRRSSSQSRRYHNLKLSHSISVPFPVTRATSAPSPGPDPEAGLEHPAPTSNLPGSDAPAQEYSWEWGAFPRRSPAFVKGKDGQWNTVGKAKGKTRVMTTSDLGHETPSVVYRRRSDVDVSDLESIRSHSVPPEVGGSPMFKRTALKRTDEDRALGVEGKEGSSDEYPDDVRGPVKRDHERRDSSPGLGVGGKLRASRGDPTRFILSIEGRTMVFELSVLQEGATAEVFDGRDEVEADRMFEAGKVDLRRFLEDESVINHETLTIRWFNFRYITRRDHSPLMQALRLWRDAAIQDAANETTSLGEVPTRAPSPPLSDDEDGRTEKDGGEEEHLPNEVPQAHSEPVTPPTPAARKPTSSSWVRWWIRSRNKEVSDSSNKGTRPAFRPSASDSLQKAQIEVDLSKAIDGAQAESTAPAESVPKNTHVSLGGEGGPGILEAQKALPTTGSKKYAKTLRLTSDQLKLLHLKPGPNRITFSLSATGVVACTARIFVWDSTDLVVVSDIDGTITKSDGLGHVFAMIGRDWTHSGVAKLYTDITRNGYKIMYLTSRAIGQADSTRDYLRSIKQDDYQLPEGPVIMSPDRLMASLHREVIMRKPEIFKMACLRDIQRLFGDTTRAVFYAGFGNRITDAMSYRSVNIPSARIFTIDHTGEVKMELLELAGYKSSYIHMTDLVDQMFPPIHRKVAAEFTDFNYWKTPVQDFPLPDLSPPSPALSARSDVSNQSTLARLRNFSLVGSRQTNVKTLNLSPPATASGGLTTPEAESEARSSSLRQMSSLERLSSTLTSFTGSSRSSSQTSRRRSLSPASYSSSSLTFLDSESEGEDEPADGVSGEKRRRRRRRSITSMPGSLDDMRMDITDEEETHAEGEEQPMGDIEQGYAQDEAVAAEHAFDEDFFTTGEMKNVPFL